MGLNEFLFSRMNDIHEENEVVKINGPTDHFLTRIWKTKDGYLKAGIENACSYYGEVIKALKTEHKNIFSELEKLSVIKQKEIDVLCIFVSMLTKKTQESYANSSANDGEKKYDRSYDESMDIFERCVEVWRSDLETTEAKDFMELKLDEKYSDGRYVCGIEKIN